MTVRASLGTAGSVNLMGAGGTLLVGDRFGPTTGPWIILLHGAGQTRHAWVATAHMLTDMGYRTLSLDLRGHGDSDWSAQSDYSLSALQEDLRAVLACIDAPAVVIGASLGGLASLLVAGEGPQDRVQALVLVDVASAPDPRQVDKIRAFMSANPDGFESVEAASEAISAYLPHRPPRRDTSGLAKNLRRRDGRLYWHWDPSFTHAIAGHLTEEERLMRAATLVTAPALLIRGEYSEIVSPEDAARLQYHMPQLQVITVSDARHMVAGDENTAFGAVLRDFLRENAPVDGATARAGGN
jgi:pimeloyl-ACP methyl ester carboxylesterase